MSEWDKLSKNYPNLSKYFISGGHGVALDWGLTEKALLELDQLREENKQLKESNKTWERAFQNTLSDRDKYLKKLEAIKKENKQLRTRISEYFFTTKEQEQKLGAIRKIAPILQDIIDFSLGDGYPTATKNYEVLEDFKKEVLGDGV